MPLPRHLLALLAVMACDGSAASGTGDAPSTGDGTSSDAVLGMSRCGGDPTLTCTSETMQLDGRTVTYALPLGTAPATGWPTVVFYQGSFIPGSAAFTATRGTSFGQYQLTATVKALLDSGHAVIAPNALGDGQQYWQTNVPPYATSWDGCADDVFVTALLAALDEGAFGPLDATRRYAMGISSGGFMSSRMAVSYPGTFRALAIVAASYATCSAACSVPTLPADHPPTLFLHGALDNIVPMSAMVPYRDALASKAETIIDAAAGHEWIADAVAAIPAFFAAH